MKFITAAVASVIAVATQARDTDNNYHRMMLLEEPSATVTNNEFFHFKPDHDDDDPVVPDKTDDDVVVVDDPTAITRLVDDSEKRAYSVLPFSNLTAPAPLSKSIALVVPDFNTSNPEDSTV